MCGIFGSLSDNATKKVLDGLKKLEYRGYDSAGIAALFPDQKGPIMVEKIVGYVSDLATKEAGKLNGSTISIGHTRWATHGKVSETNAHPHSSSDGMLTIVHNGIIENATELSDFLIDEGYLMKSETDSEVIAHLVDHAIQGGENRESHLDAFNDAISKLEGSWAVACIISGLEGILISKNESPLIIGRAKNDFAISSDILALHGASEEYYSLKDGEIFLVSPNGIVQLEGLDEPEFQPIVGEYVEQDPGEYQHMMKKEIYDQPISLSSVIGGRLSSDGKHAKLSGFKLSPDEIKTMKRLNFVGCGTAFHASLMGQFYLREMTGMEVNAFRSSEFDAQRFAGENTLTIGITQSGETKDTMQALIEARNTGGNISSICNVIGSSISRLTGNGAYLHAGPEYAVASTKAYTSMVAAVLLLSISLNEGDANLSKTVAQELRNLPNRVRNQLKIDPAQIESAAEIISNSDRVIVIGKGSSYVTAEEAALKIMEVTYIPCLAYPSGELKHGPLALIQEGTPVIVIDQKSSGLSNNIKSNVEECRSRGAKIIHVTDNWTTTNESDIVIRTEKNGIYTSPILSIIPIQLISYRAAIMLELNPDRPRNLAKSVTVV